MKWDLFKNKLKKEAQQQENAVDIDALWSAIEPDVDALNGEGKKRRRFFFWFFFGTAVALTGAWFALSNEDVVKNGMVAGNGDLIEERSALPESDGSDNNLITNESLIKKDTELLTDDLNPTTVQRVSGNQKEKIAENGNASTISSKIENTTSVLSKVKKAIIQKEIKNNSLNNTSNNSNENDSSLAGNANDSSVATTKNNPQTNETTKVQTNLNESSSLLQTENAVTPSEKEIPKTNKDVTQTAILSIKTISRININSLLESWKNKSLPIKENLFSEPFVFISSQDYFYKAGDKRKSKKPSITFTAGVTGGISYANRNLSQKEGAEGLIFQYRDQYESPMETTHYGFFIGAKHKKYNLGITIGLQNTTITERYSYNSVVESTEMIAGVQVRRINLDGDTINVMGDVLETTTATIDKNIYNSYRLLEIPVTLSYHFPFGKWNLGLEAGILANLSLKTKGIVPNELLEVPSAVNMRDQDIDNSKNDLFKTKIGLGYQFGLSAGGAVVGNLEWRVAPMLRIYPSDFAGGINELSQRYVLYGVNAGFAYRF